MMLKNILQKVHYRQLLMKIKKETLGCYKEVCQSNFSAWINVRLTQQEYNLVLDCATDKNTVGLALGRGLGLGGLKV